MCMYEVRNRLDNSLIAKGSAEAVANKIGCNVVTIYDTVNTGRYLGYIMEVKRVTPKYKHTVDRSKVKFDLYYHGNLVRQRATAKQLSNQLNVGKQIIYNAGNNKSYILGGYTVERVKV